MLKHYVKFYYVGALFSEVSVKVLFWKSLYFRGNKKEISKREDSHRKY